MSSLIADERWYRVGPIKPYLLAGVDISPHEYRGERWFVLRDPVNGELHRIDRPAYEVVRHLDGYKDVAAIHDALLAAQGEKAPTQQDMMQLLAELAQTGLIQTDRAGDVEQLKWRDRQRRRKLLTDRINPLSFKVTMFNVEPIIDRLAPLARILFSQSGAMLMGGIVLLAAALALVSNQEIAADVARIHASPSFLFLMWLAYPLLKALHELAHALAARCYGARVTDIGIRLMVLMPVPYVDASMSALLTDKSQRALVAGAGIAAELVIASAATLLWLQIEPGLFRDFLLASMLVGTVSTLFFNGNPLLRFDGYYVLTDLIELPNLARRSRQYLLNVVMIHGLRIRRVARMHTAPGERPWLLGYAVASWVYRVLIFTSIAIFVARIHQPAGILVIVAAMATLVILPLARGALFLQGSPTLVGRRALTGTLIASYVAVLSAVFVVPAPNSTVAEGVVWLPEQAMIRAVSSGTLASLKSEVGTHVTPGTPIAQLANADLELAVATLTARLSGLEVERLGKLAVQSPEANTLLPELDRTRDELDKARQALADLALHARTSGRLVVPNARDLIDTWFDQGKTLGYVLGAPTTTVRVALTNDEALRLRRDVTSVQVRLSEEPGRSWPARVSSEAPAALKELPSAALGRPAGGRIAVDPTDEHGRRTLEPVFVVDVEIPERAVTRAGATALVRFDHPHEALLLQASTALRRLFLSHFDS